jgi:hypothetical protein
LNKFVRTHSKRAFITVLWHDQRQGAERLKGYGVKTTRTAGNCGALLTIEEVQDPGVVATLKIAPVFVCRLFNVLDLNRRPLGFWWNTPLLHVVLLEKQ